MEKFASFLLYNNPNRNKKKATKKISKPNSQRSYNPNVGSPLFTFNSPLPPISHVPNPLFSNSNLKRNNLLPPIEGRRSVRSSSGFRGGRKSVKKKRKFGWW